MHGTRGRIEPVTAAANAALSKVDDRLDQIQNSIAALTQQVYSIANPGSSHEFTADYTYSPSNASTFDSRPRIGGPRYGTANSTRPYGHRMPNLMTFLAPPSLVDFSYDNGSQFYTGEVAQGDILYASIEQALMNHVHADFSPQTCWRLQRAFVSGLLRWMPLIDDETCFQHVQAASVSNYSDKSISSCLALLVFAIGAMAVDGHLYHEDPRQLPGFEYFVLSYEILRETRLPMGDINVLQCRTLLAVYLCFAMRPVQSWNEINKTSRECMIMLRTNWTARGGVDADMKGRTFWMAYVIENELEVCLELPSSGMRAFQETLSLPTSSVDEEGLYYFLALISLRKLLVEVIETIGFKSGRAIYAPIVAVELRNQIRSWHEHLPTSLRFTLDATPLFDLRKAYLRSQWFCLSSVIYWPFVLRHVENLAAAAEGDQMVLEEELNERAAVHERAKECVEFCVLHLRASEGIMMQKTFVSHSSIRAFYAIAMGLLLAYQPVYNCAPPSDIVLVFERSLVILGLWDNVPFMKEPLKRIHHFAEEAGWFQTRPQIPG
ncbi:hypothetical protein BP6252_05407 [Coleophoma cylindrospora]|uniref:Xylanolytic transcriptional activator regulatory domain-containing protein n=1 Tax=Coleophoma cylindrospora TaxID=1849047 RepID=A0A3D8RU26_9HELO|nr:hypothetical protein BP6252_05407 [Coleophoma cylindrospora]